MEAWRKELYHHGIKGQKWGIRRFQNPDGTLTPDGKKRYSSNEDSDNFAKSAGYKYKALANFKRTKEKITDEIRRNPKGVDTKRLADEHITASKITEFAFKEHSRLEDMLRQKYESLNYDFIAEAKTGEIYVRSMLKDKVGEQYVSEFYLGERIREKEAKKMKQDVVL